MVRGQAVQPVPHVQEVVRDFAELSVRRGRDGPSGPAGSSRPGSCPSLNFLSTSSNRRAKSRRGERSICHTRAPSAVPTARIVHACGFIMRSPALWSIPSPPDHAHQYSCDPDERPARTCSRPGRSSTRLHCEQSLSRQCGVGLRLIVRRTGATSRTRQPFTGANRRPQAGSANSGTEGESGGGQMSRAGSGLSRSVTGSPRTAAPCPRCTRLPSTGRDPSPNGSRSRRPGGGGAASRTSESPPRRRGAGR